MDQSKWRVIATPCNGQLSLLRLDPILSKHHRPPNCRKSPSSAIDDRSTRHLLCSTETAEREAQTTSGISSDVIGTSTAPSYPLSPLSICICDGASANLAFCSSSGGKHGTQSKGLGLASKREPCGRVPNSPMHQLLQVFYVEFRIR